MAILPIAHALISFSASIEYTASAAAIMSSLAEFFDLGMWGLR